MQIIHTDKAPKAIGPYSQAVKANNMLFVSGQVPFVPETMEIVEGGVKRTNYSISKKCRSYTKRSWARFYKCCKNYCIYKRYE